MSIGITGATADLWGRNAESTANKGSWSFIHRSGG